MVEPQMKLNEAWFFIKTSLGYEGFTCTSRDFT